MSVFSIRLILKVYKPFNIKENISGIVTDVKENNYIVKLYNQKIILYTKRNNIIRCSVLLINDFKYFIIYI